MKKLVKVRLINWHYLSNETVEIKGNTFMIFCVNFPNNLLMMNPKIIGNKIIFIKLKNIPQISKFKVVFSKQ